MKDKRKELIELAVDYAIRVANDLGLDLTIEQSRDLTLTFIDFFGRALVETPPPPGTREKLLRLHRQTFKSEPNN